MGRKPAPKKVDQLEKWPEPEDPDDVNSFLAFVNYLREFMDPESVKHERFLAPHQKKMRYFKKLWQKPQREAFEKIRTMLARDAVLRHVDYRAAARPAHSGRPLDLFIDASDYGWCGTRGQRLDPMGRQR